MTTDQGHDDKRGRKLLEQARELLAGDQVRVVLNSVVNLTAGKSVPAARIETRPDWQGRWRKADLPLIMPPEDGPQTRAAVLRTLADILESE